MNIDSHFLENIYFSKSSVPSGSIRTTCLTWSVQLISFLGDESGGEEVLVVTNSRAGGVGLAVRS